MHARVHPFVSCWHGAAPSHPLPGSPIRHPPASPIIRNVAGFRFAMFPTACVYDDFVLGTPFLLLERRPCSHTRMKRRRNRKQRRNCTALFRRDVGPFTTDEPHEASPVVHKIRACRAHSLFGHLLTARIIISKGSCASCTSVGFQSFLSRRDCIQPNSKTVASALRFLLS
jgi:hypothetical protein